jgi:hypothetical protein
MRIFGGDGNGNAASEIWLRPIGRRQGLNMSAILPIRLDAEAFLRILVDVA